MDVAITASSPGAVSSSPDTGPSVTNLDNARAIQARQDSDDAQRKIEEQRAAAARQDADLAQRRVDDRRVEAARQAQATQASRNSNGDVVGTTISTTA